MLNIRPMLTEDASQVAAIEKMCFSTPWSEQDFCDSLKQEAAHFYVAEEDGKILGYVGLYRSFEEGEITNVAVDLKARGRHIATGLMQKLHDDMKHLGAERILLEVRVSNAPAIALYEGLGYTTIGTRKGFYDFPKEDGLLMEKRLS